jgi:hypothetical protein
MKAHHLAIVEVRLVYWTKVKASETCISKGGKNSRISEVRVVL